MPYFLAYFGMFLALATAAQAAEPVRVALLPVAVHSLEEGEHLRAGLAEMLSTRLEQIPEIEVLRVEDPAAATSSLREARERGRALGADYVLFGSFTHFGEGASLDLQCASLHSKKASAARRLFVQSGKIGEIIPKLDELSQKVASYVLHPEVENLPAVSAPPAGRSAAVGDGDVSELERRIEALERVVFPGHLQALQGTDSPAPNSNSEALR